MLLHDTFAGGVKDIWQVSEVGRGAAVVRNDMLHLTLQRTPADTYSNAQISDYDPSQRNFRLKPPLHLTVRAYSQTPVEHLKGTGGFGFWNHPFSPDTSGFALPQALWFFFGSPDNNMALAQGVAGHGWKAATFNAKRWQFLSLLPTAPLGFLLMRIPPVYRALWQVGQRALAINEAPLDLSLLSQYHTYTLDWLPDRARFAVDGEVVQDVKTGLPTSPLGFVAWLDNQYAIVTPQGHFKFGTIAVEQTQALILDQVIIETD